jgi:hypothetical protein
VSQTCSSDLRTILGEKYSFEEARENVEGGVGDLFTMANGLPKPLGPTTIRPSHSRGDVRFRSYYIVLFVVSFLYRKKLPVDISKKIHKILYTLEYH